jgi:4-diphosphocytidyl-2-C-methyl-D-erythritol kinase
MRLSAFAPAKVNLFLHVGGPDAEGYHPISSLMVFADVGDQVMMQPPTRRPSRPRAVRRRDPGRDDNLVMRAARAFHAAAGRAGPAVSPDPRQAPADRGGPGRRLQRRGRGLALLRDALAPDLSDDDLEPLAASLGADGAACLWGAR